MFKREVQSDKAFTLIELMVVVSIIGILVAMLFIALDKVQKSAARTKAKIHVRQLEKALVAFHDEYGEWPKNMTDYDSDPQEGSLTGIEVEEKLVKVLAAIPSADTDEYNPRKIKFLPKAEINMSRDGGGSKKGYLDPWGHCYKYMCDYNDDGILLVQFSKVSDSGDKSVKLNGRGVAVWSRGPDGMDALGGDDVTSWNTQ